MIASILPGAELGCPLCAPSPALSGGRCAACLLRAAVPRRVAGYELFGKLGAGGMGEVYLARHVDAEVSVAIKLAKAEVASQAGGAALLVQEIKTWSSLRHANIVRVHTSGLHEGQPFLVMELLEGGSLRDDANRAKHAHPSSALQLTLEIAYAVRFAHRHGVIHCDLKPENILFDAEGRPHVSDFGLARRFTTDGSAPASVLGGTIGWMSPEQGLREPVMTASDVFSLGAMLYWLVRGELPFAKETDPPHIYLEKVRAGLPGARRGWSPDLCAALEVVWRRALEPDADRRYPSAAAFAADLERIRDDFPLEKAATPLRGRAWLWSNRHPLARLLIPLFFALAAVGLLLLAEDQAEKLERDAREANGSLASAQALAALFQLHQYGEIIRAAAEDEKVRDLLLPFVPKDPADAAKPPPRQNPCSTQPPMQKPDPLVPYAAHFDSLVVLNTDGCMRARRGHEDPPPGFERRRFDWRDYFAGAQEIVARGEHTIHIRYCPRRRTTASCITASSRPERRSLCRTTMRKSCTSDSGAASRPAGGSAGAMLRRSSWMTTRTRSKETRGWRRSHPSRAPDTWWWCRPAAPMCYARANGFATCPLPRVSWLSCRASFL